LRARSSRPHPIPGLAACSISPRSREAAVFSDGLRLGPIGGRIVAETLLGLLARDEFSYLNSGFTPTLPSQPPGTFKMTDLLRWARVDPASRGQ
jgi:hypothetical protein